MKTHFFRNALAVLAMAATAMLASRQTRADAGASAPVAVLVRVPIPAGMDHTQIEAAMAKTVPTYQNAPGLIRKYFIVSDDQKLGGIYLWESRKVAEAWYDESVVWHAGVSKLSGLHAELTYFDVPIVVDNQHGHGVASGQPAGAGGPVAVVVKLPALPGVDRAQMEVGMAQTVPTYENLPGLIRKYFIISDDLSFGGIYLWESRKTAEAWYNESVVWHAGASKRSGRRAELTYFDVPIVTEGQSAHK